MILTSYTKEALLRLCNKYAVIFNGIDYESVEVIGMPKPTLEEVLAKANEIELEFSKLEYAKISKSLEAEARNKIAGNQNSNLVSHWSNQRFIAEKILHNTASEIERDCFLAELELRNSIEGYSETLEDFCNKILAKSNEYTLKMCRISGALKLFLSQINLVKTKEELITLFEKFKSRLN
jgi:hypothetical protein